MLARVALVVASTVSFSSAAPAVNTNNTTPVTFTTIAANPYGVQVAPSNSIVVTDTTAGAQITSLTCCFDKTTVYWQYFESLTCPAPASLAAAGNLQCAFLDSQTAANGGCISITGLSSPAAYSTVAWQVRYVNAGLFGGALNGPRVLNYVATDSTGAMSPLLAAPVVVEVVGDVAIAPCPAFNSVPGTVAQATTITTATASSGQAVLILSNFAIESANQLFQAHVRIVSNCQPEDTLFLDYATGAPMAIQAQYFPATCDLTLTLPPGGAAALSNATWTTAIQNVAYQNVAGAGTNITVGTRGVSVFATQQNPVECNTPYGTATLTITAALPTVSATVTGSASVSSSVSPAPPAAASGATGVILSGTVAALLLGATLAAMN
jgi:hypothetical protein